MQPTSSIDHHDLPPGNDILLKGHYYLKLMHIETLQRTTLLQAHRTSHRCAIHQDAHHVFEVSTQHKFSRVSLKKSLSWH